MGSSTGCLPKNRTARHGIWKKRWLYTSCSSKFTISLEWKQDSTPHVVGCFPSSPLWKCLHPSLEKALHKSLFCLFLGLGQLRKEFITMHFLFVFTKNMFGRSGWVLSLFVLFLSLSGPMCVALASIHTAVQAGRLCPEGTSVLFVSYSILKSYLMWYHKTQRRR